MWFLLHPICAANVWLSLIVKDLMGSDALFDYPNIFAFEYEDADRNRPEVIFPLLLLCFVHGQRQQTIERC